MNARDELIEILHREATADRVKNSPLRDVPVVAAKVEATADAILAAGYRRPRVVATVAELDALSEGAVIRSDDSGDSAQKDHEGYWYLWGGDVGLVSEEITIPATVLHEPEADQ